MQKLRPYVMTEFARASPWYGAADSCLHGAIMGQSARTTKK